MDFFTPSFVAPVRKELGCDMIVVSAPKYKCQILLMLVNNKYIATMGQKSKTPCPISDIRWGWLMVMHPGELSRSLCVYSKQRIH